MKEQVEENFRYARTGGFQSPCGELVMKVPMEDKRRFSNQLKDAVNQNPEFQSPCGELVMKEKAIFRFHCLNFKVSVPLRGIGYERRLMNLSN